MTPPLLLTLLSTLPATSPATSPATPVTSPATPVTTALTTPMMAPLTEQSWFVWSIGLAVAFPLAVLVLGEIVSRLRSERHPLVAPLRLARNWAVPLLVAWLFLRQVMLWPGDSLPVRLVSTAFYLVALATVLGLVNAVLFRQADRRSWRSRVPALFLDLSRFLLVLVGTSVILSTVWGQDLGGLLTALGVGSIVIGLALQDTLGNVFAGIAILFEKPYTVGDWIRYGDHLGRVTEINWRSTRLDTHFGDTVIVPNGEIARNVLMNENNLVNPRYETFDIGFAYEHPPNQVKAVLLETVRATAGVLPQPPPQVFTVCYNDFSIDYQIRFAVADIAELPAIRDDFVTRIWYTAKRHRLNIPFPIRTVYKYDGPNADEAESRQERTLGRDAVASVLPVEIDSSLSEQATVKRFAEGEQITRRGEMVRELNLIVAGVVEMVEPGPATSPSQPSPQPSQASQASPPDSDREPVRLGPGEIFGIQALLRKRPSTFDVWARSDAVLVSLGYDLIMDLVATKPGFAFQLEKTIESRSVDPTSRTTMRSAMQSASGPSTARPPAAP